MKFNRSNVGKNNRGNNKVGVKLSHYIKGYVFNEDDSIDLIVSTNAKTSSATRKRSKYTTITRKEFTGLQAACAWTEGVHTHEGETNTGEEIHFFVDVNAEDEDNNRMPYPQSKFFGAVIDGNTLSATCELGVFRHYFAGFQNAVYSKRNGDLAVNNELITTKGIRAVYALQNDGELVTEPVYFDDSVNFTNELIDGKLIKDTSFDDMLTHYNATNGYGLEFILDNNCFVDLEHLQAICSDNDIQCANIDRALDSDSFQQNYEYTEFVQSDEVTQVASKTTTLTLDALSHLTTKGALKKYAKTEKGLVLKFAAKLSINEMKEQILNAVNA